MTGWVVAAMAVVSYFGYEDCIALENASGTRVVLCPHGGGRVLEYALHRSTNAIYLASNIDANLEALTDDPSPQVRPARDKRCTPRHH